VEEANGEETQVQAFVSEAFELEPRQLESHLF
jgi:hypothetical protein